MRYQGWNFEKTLLIRERSNIAREAEFLDVPLAVESERAASLARDVRVILKKDWNVLDREIPCQVHRIECHGQTTTFRVAFNLDLPAGAAQRVGVYYDNPNAPAPSYESNLEVNRSNLGVNGSSQEVNGDRREVISSASPSDPACGFAKPQAAREQMECRQAGYKIDTPFYTVETDPKSGQIKTFLGKIDDQGTANLHRLNPPEPNAIQPGNVVIFAVEDKSANGCRAVSASAADWASPRIAEQASGPLFFKQTRRGRLAPPGADAGRPWPELEITYKFFAEQPYILVHSKLTFPEDTNVFGVYNDVISLSRAQFSHYTFRPVSPALPLTDVEEMGHILVDPIHAADLPLGVAFSDFLPYTQPWHAFVNIHALAEQAFAGIQLASTIRTPDGQPITYRPATYLIREQKAVQWFRAPIYVHTRDRRENMVRVPAGTVFEDLNALHYSRWDPGWGQRLDGLGKRLNNPLEVTSHPIYLGAVPPEAFEPLPHGQRADAYLRAGVR